MPAPLPLGADVVAGLPVPDVANQQSSLGAVLDRADREAELVGEVQDSSGTDGSDRHNELLPLRDAGELMEVILQGKKQDQQKCVYYPSRRKTAVFCHFAQ